MVEKSVRLERLIEHDVGECCAGDVDDRLETLDAYASGLSDQQQSSDLRTLQALGNETRYRIVRLLARADGELCVCEISPVFDVSDSAISHALSDLADAGLVSRRREGTWRYYDVTDRTMTILDALDASRGGNA